MFSDGPTQVGKPLLAKVCQYLYTTFLDNFNKICVDTQQKVWEYFAKKNIILWKGLYPHYIYQTVSFQPVLSALLKCFLIPLWTPSDVTTCTICSISTQTTSQDGNQCNKAKEYLSKVLLSLIHIMCLYLFQEASMPQLKNK